MILQIPAICCCNSILGIKILAHVGDTSCDAGTYYRCMYVCAPSQISDGISYSMCSCMPMACLYGRQGERI